MAHSDLLRELRENTVINEKSKLQDKALGRVVLRTIEWLREEFPGIRLRHQPTWMLTDIVANLSLHFPDVDFHSYNRRSHMRPDGGILRMLDCEDKSYPILIGEMKSQGTNDQRLKEGKPRQSQGNAIERLGKNVIGFRTAMML